MAKKIDVKKSLSGKLSEWKEFSLPAKIGIISAVVAELAAKVGVWRDSTLR